MHMWCRHFYLVPKIVSAYSVPKIIHKYHTVANDYTLVCSAKDYKYIPSAKVCAYLSVRMRNLLLGRHPARTCFWLQYCITVAYLWLIWNKVKTKVLLWFPVVVLTDLRSSDLRIGVIQWWLSVLLTSQASECWINRRCLIWEDSKFKKRELQWSSY